MLLDVISAVPQILQRLGSRSVGVLLAINKEYHTVNAAHITSISLEGSESLSLLLRQAWP